MIFWISPSKTFFDDSYLWSFASLSTLFSWFNRAIWGIKIDIFLQNTLQLYAISYTILQGNRFVTFTEISQRCLLFSKRFFYNSIEPDKTSGRFFSFLITIKCLKIRQFGYLHPYALSSFICQYSFTNISWKIDH